MINARSETVATKPAYRHPFKNRRCLIPADGFYQWKKTNAGERPYFITRPDGEPFAFAGLWDRWTNRKNGEGIDSATILTTKANEFMKPLHDRMPLILEAQDYDQWLDVRANDTAAMRDLLRPYQGNDLIAFPVSAVVNSLRNESSQCVEPLTKR
jgi:putative SOS response-associated peptidase YedK